MMDKELCVRLQNLLKVSHDEIWINLDMAKPLYSEIISRVYLLYKNRLLLPFSSLAKLHI